MTDAVQLAEQIKRALNGAHHISTQAYLIETSGHMSTEAATVRDNARLRCRETYKAISESITRAINICEDTVMRHRLLHGVPASKLTESSVHQLPCLTIGDDAVTVARAIDGFLAASFANVPAEFKAEFDLRALSLQIVDALNNAHGINTEQHPQAKRA